MFIYEIYLTKLVNNVGLNSDVVTFSFLAFDSVFLIISRSVFLSPFQVFHVFVFLNHHAIRQYSMCNKYVTVNKDYV